MSSSDNKIKVKRECSIGEITLRDDNILMFKPYNHITTANLSDLKEMYAIFMEVTNGIPHLYYSDNTNIESFGSEERAYVSSSFHNFASACAIKENSAITRFITHSLIYLNKPRIPLKMFKNESEAINWLKSLNQ